jgi:RimJ/RimL family protein N-acetyltransferase
MLRGEKVALRARQVTDIAVLEELHDDVVTWSRSDNRPWRPIPPGSPESPFTPTADDADKVARFTVVEVASGEPAGDAVLWGIDTHNRFAHIGLSLRPAFRGRGLGTDIVRVMSRYGFEIRGLHRLQIDTLADNFAMICAAKRAGFVQEGMLRRSAWVNGEFADEVLLGLLADEWRKSSRT